MSHRILALDHGTKRIGVALSDELGWTAQPLETFERRTIERDVAHIRNLIRTHDVGQVLLGLPLRLNGEEGPAVQTVREFGACLSSAIPVPVVFWDERMTTKEAEELLIAADVSRKKRKGVVDRVAAAILLQSYLDARTPAPAAPPSSGDDSVSLAEWESTPNNDGSYETTPVADRVSPPRRARRPGRVSDESMG